MLTREAIEAMTGAEVDAYLAEKVMGWMAVESDWVDGRNGVYFTRPIGGPSCWVPSTYLDDAMQAAEKVGSAYSLTGPGPCIGGILAKHDGNWYHAYAPTPALAVCRAVIAAHEAQEGTRA